MIGALAFRGMRFLNFGVQALQQQISSNERDPAAQMGDGKDGFVMHFTSRKQQDHKPWLACSLVVSMIE